VIRIFVQPVSGPYEGVDLMKDGVITQWLSFFVTIVCPFRSSPGVIKSGSHSSSWSPCIGEWSPIRSSFCYHSRRSL